MCKKICQQPQGGCYSVAVAAPAQDFTRLPKTQAFMTGNLFNNSVCKPNVILYRNKPESFFVRFAYSLGVMNGTWTITHRAEGEKLQEKKDIIICRGYMPKEPVFKNLPEIQKTKFEIENEEKMQKKLEYQLAKEKIKEEVRAEKSEKKREKAAESGKPIPDSKAAYFYDEENSFHNLWQSRQQRRCRQKFKNNLRQAYGVLFAFGHRPFYKRKSGIRL